MNNPVSTPGEGTSRRGTRKWRVRRSEPTSEDKSRLREGEAPNQRSGAANSGDALFPLGPISRSSLRLLKRVRRPCSTFNAFWAKVARGVSSRLVFSISQNTSLAQSDSWSTGRGACPGDAKLCSTSKIDENPETYGSHQNYGYRQQQRCDSLPLSLVLWGKRYPSPPPESSETALQRRVAIAEQIWRNSIRITWKSTSSRWVNHF